MKDLPGASGELPEEQSHGERTGKVMKYVDDAVLPIASKMEASEAFSKRMAYWATGVITIFLLGGSAVIFFERYATASDLEKLEASQQQTAKALNDHIADEAHRTGELEAQTKNIESDYHSIREQLWRIADHTGAPRVAEPTHVTPAAPAHIP